MMPRKRSSLWNHFEPVGIDKGMCNHCERIISTKGGSIGNLLRHVQRKHTDIDINCEGFVSKSDKTECIIRSVFLRRALWDENDWGFGQDDLIESLWNEISEETGITVDMLKTQWAELKSAYRRQLKLFEKTGRSKWVHFDALDFLNPTNNKKFCLNGEQTQNITTMELINTEDESDITNVKIHDSNTYDMMKTVEMESSPVRYTKIQDWQSESSILREFLMPKRKRQMIENIRSIDEDLSFFHSLLPYIKKLPLLKKLELRNEINSAVSKYLNENEDSSNIICTVDSN